VYETEADLLNLLMTQSINVRFLSEEYKDRDFTGKQFCIENGIELFYHPRKHIYSTSELRNRVYALEANKRSEVNTKEILQHSTELLK
jgi:glycerol-3-phosphate cytidylyltransferase